MKAVSEYMIGNTAVRIVDTGRRIRVIDVEKENRKRQYMKVAAATLFAALLSLIVSLPVVRFHNSHTILDKRIYSLKAEINDLEQENNSLLQRNQEHELSYDEIYKKATALGMHFPTNSRVKSYKYKKGSGIKVYQAN